jgi:hypothetical protein
MIRRFELRTRREIIGKQGMDITRKFYIDPYSHHPIVVAALVGGIVDSARKKPNADPYYPFCYCVGVEVEAVDEMQSCGDPSTGFVHKDAASVQEDYNKIRDALNSKEVLMGANLNGLATVRADLPADAVSETGGWITARYKPLVSGLARYVSGDGDENVGIVQLGKNQPAKPIRYNPGNNDADAFDYVDPLLVPQRKFVSNPRSLFFVSDGKAGAKCEFETLTTQAYAVFTVRRVMVRNVPIKTIAKLMGKVNAQAQIIGEYTFPPECMRFNGCEPTKIVMPNKTGGLTTWFDLQYSFDINLTYDQCYKSGWVWNLAGIPMPGLCVFEQDYAGWNRILANAVTNDPSGTLPLEWAPLAYYPVASKEALIQTQVPWFPDNMRPQYPWAESTEDIGDEGFGKLFDWSSE